MPSQEEKDLIKSQIAHLRQVKASGVLSSTQDGQTTTFRSMAEIDRAIRSLQRRLGTGNPRYTTINIRGF